MSSNAKRIAAICGGAAVLVAIVLLVLSRRDSPERKSSTFLVGTVGLGDIATLDPHMAGTALPIMIVWHMYDRLVDIAPDGRLSPMIAESWDRDESMRQWSFHIRSDVYFNPQSPEVAKQRVTPKDIQASIERALRRPGYARTLLGDIVVGAQQFIAGETTTLEGISTSENRVTFRLTRSFSYLPERLAVSFFSIVPADTAPDGESPPLGSGPFYLHSWDRVTQSVVLKRNREYWQAVSPDCPDTLTFRVIETEAAAVEEVRSRGITWLEATSAVLPLLRDQPHAGGLRIESIPTTTIRLVALNMERSPFREHPDLGVALNLATNRQALVKALGAGTPAGGAVPEDVLPDTPHWLLFNPSKAQEMLSTLPADAHRLEMLVEPGHEPRMIAELLRQQWAAVGVDVNLRHGLADFFPRVIGGEYQTALGYYGPFVPSVDQYLWLCRADAQPVPNVMRFTDARFEDFVNRMAASSTGASSPALDSALAILAERPPAVWLIRSPRIQVTRAPMKVPRSAGIPLFHRLNSVEHRN